MDTKYQLLRFDYWIQKIMGVALIICCCTVVGIPFGALGLIPFGAAQVLSGLVFAIGYQDKKRAIYLLAVAAFFMCWYAITTVSYDSRFYEASKGIGVILCFIPPAFGIWYFRLTADEYADLKIEREANLFSEEQILDA